MVQVQRIKKFGTIAGTFAFALLIGYVMQYGDADASRFASPEAVAGRTVLPAQIDTSPLQKTRVLEPKIPAPVQLSANLSESIRSDPNAVKLTALVGDKADSVLPTKSVYIERAGHEDMPTCAIELQTNLGPTATVDLSIYSSCRPDMAFEVQHGNLVVSGLTDEDGAATLNLPALEVNGSFAVIFEDARFAATSIVVPEAENYHRVVLQWADKPGEYIRYRDDAAIMPGALTRLGEDTGASNRFAEVYTMPTSQRLADGLDNLTVQAEVTQASCDRPFLAQRFHVNSGVAVETKDIRITLPTCDYAGTYLELKKVLGGQTLLP